MAFTTESGDVFFFLTDRRAWERLKGNPLPGEPTYVGRSGRFLYVKTDFPPLFAQIDLDPLPAPILASLNLGPDFSGRYLFEPADPEAKLVRGAAPALLLVAAALGSLEARRRGRRRRRRDRDRERLLDAIRAFSHTGECTRQFDRLKRLSINSPHGRGRPAEWTDTLASLRGFLNDTMRDKLGGIIRLARRARIKGRRDVRLSYRRLLRGVNRAFARAPGGLPDLDQVLPELQAFETAMAGFKRRAIEGLRLDLGAELEAYTRDRSLRDRRIRFSLHIATAETAVYIARQDLWALLDILVTNSAEASPPDRQVSVTLSILGVPSGSVLDVRDDGPGLSPEVRAGLFGKNHSTKSGLRGYGLYWAREIMRMNGGSIEHVESTAPGAAFRISFFRL
jgi:signal transduction histidine kinase